MGDVACGWCAPYVAEIRARGFEPEQLAAGLELDVAELESPRHRIPWASFTVLTRRAAEILGGVEELEEIAARTAEQTVPHVLRRLLPHLGSARPIYLVGVRWWGPWIFRGTRATCEQLADGRLREVIQILPGYAECPEFFHAIRGVLRAMPRLFGQPDAVVELDQDGRRGEFLIALPPPRRRMRLGLRRRASISSLPEDLEELGFRQEQLRHSQALLGRLARRLEEEIDERRRLERSLERALRGGALGRLADGMAGDLNNFLAVILGYASLAAEALPDTSPTRGQLAEIRQASERAGELVHQFLALSRQRDPTPRAVALDETLRTLAPLLRQLVGKDGALEVCCAIDLAPVLVEPARLEQVLVDLVARLREAGSRLVRIEARGVAVDEGREAPCQAVELELRGQGLELAPQARAGDPEPLGFSAVGPFGASVDVQREAGGATCIRIRVPLLAATEALEERTPLDAAFAASGGQTVLLVEEDEWLRRVGRRILESGGYRVIEARSGPDALALCAARAAPIHLLLSHAATPSFDRKMARRAMELRPELRGVLMLRPPGR